MSALDVVPQMLPPFRPILTALARKRGLFLALVPQVLPQRLLILVRSGALPAQKPP